MCPHSQRTLDSPPSIIYLLARTILSPKYHDMRWNDTTQASSLVHWKLFVRQCQNSMIRTWSRLNWHSLIHWFALWKSNLLSVFSLMWFFFFFSFSFLNFFYVEAISFLSARGKETKGRLNNTHHFELFDAV